MVKFMKARPSSAESRGCEAIRGETKAQNTARGQLLRPRVEGRRRPFRQRSGVRPFLRKPYRELMHSIGTKRCNGCDQAGSARVEASGDRSASLQATASAFVAQRSFRWDLTPAGGPPVPPAVSGASWTQAPSRPRRLHKILRGGFLAVLPKRAEKKRDVNDISGRTS